MMMKRRAGILRVCGLLVVSLALGLAAPAQAAPPACRLVLAPAQAAIAPGQDQALDVRVEQVTGLYAYQCTIEYDPAVLRVRDADPNMPGIQVRLGSFLQADFVQQNSVDEVQGRITVIVTQINPTPAVSGSGVLFSMDFIGLAPGSSAVRADRGKTIITNRDAEAFAVTYTDAEIGVGSNWAVFLPLLRR
jgi:hypothetical protein